MTDAVPTSNYDPDERFTDAVPVDEAPEPPADQDDGDEPEIEDEGGEG